MDEREGATVLAGPPSSPVVAAAPAPESAASESAVQQPVPEPLANLRALEDQLDWQENQERARQGARAPAASRDGLRVGAYAAAGVVGLLLLAWKLGAF